MENVIETHNLSKIYDLKGKHRFIKALNNFNVNVKEGEIFGLLGPNGAGKTTLIQILTTIIQPTSGYALIKGYNIAKRSTKAKNLLSLMLDSKMLYNRITAYSNLKFYCKMYNVHNYKQKIKEIANEFNLSEWLNQYTGRLSSGMKMKLALARTLLLNRPILILDEPTVGIDIKTKSFIIEKLKESNKTILITSHDMDVVNKLCNRIAFIDKGNLLKIGTRKDLEVLETKEIKVKIQINKKMPELKQELRRNPFFYDIELLKNNTLKIKMEQRKNFNDLIIILEKYDLLSISEIEESLENLFLKIID